MVRIGHLDWWSGLVGRRQCTCCNLADPHHVDGLILFVDGIVYRLRGRSWLMTQRREFPLLVLASVAVWLIFETYNLHLRNWRYEGLPVNTLARDTGYFWSFATIIPGVFEIVDLVLALIERVGKQEEESHSGVRTGPA